MEREMCLCGCGQYPKTQSAKYVRGHSNKDPKIKEKKKQTSIKNYGYENPNQSEMIKLKKKQTCIKNFGFENPSCSPTIKKKRIESYIDKYGVDSPMKNTEIKNKVQKIFDEKYNGHPLKCKNIKESRKQTYMDNWGVDNPAKTHHIKNKMKETCIKKYGTDHWSKTIEAREFARNKYIDRLEYNLDGKPIAPMPGNNEFEVINELQKHTDFKIQQGIKLFGLFPDGYIEELNLVIELDESYHLEAWAIEHDKIKNETYQYHKLDVFRFTEIEWLEDINSIITKFQRMINHE